MSIHARQENMGTPVYQPMGEKIESRYDRMWSSVSSILHSNDDRTAWQAACRLAKEYKPGLADRGAQKQLWKNAKPHRPELYLQDVLMPQEILRILSDEYLSEPRYIRIGKRWVTDGDGTKIKIPAKKLPRIDFLKWIQAEIYKNITIELLKERREKILFGYPVDPIIIAESLDDYRKFWDGSTYANYEKISFFLDESNDPAALLEERQERQSKSNQPSELLSRIRAKASPQRKKYIEGLKRLISKGTDPSSLEDKELSSLLDLSPQRIQQLRSDFRKKYK